MVEKLQRRFALSRKGAVDTIKGSLLCALQNISFMLPVYMRRSDLSVYISSV